MPESTRGDGRDDNERRFPRPFEQSYAVSLSVAIVSLVPYIIVTTAYTYFRLQVSSDIGTGRTGLEIIAGLSTAGYAFGALMWHTFPIIGTWVATGW